jgi:hypothetical protein
MIHYDCRSVWEMYGHLRSEMTNLLVLMETVPGSRTTPLSPKILTTISVFVADSVAQVSAQLGMEMSANNALDLKIRIDMGELYTFEAMYKELACLIHDS